MKLQTTPSAKKPFEINHIGTFKFGNNIAPTICDSFSRSSQAYL